MLDFHSLLRPASPTCVYAQEGWFVWGASMFRHGAKYYICYSRWERSKGFAAWVTDSEIALAEGDSPTGEFHFVKTVLPRRKGYWDGDCTHNPNVITVGGRHYLYYMGNWGNGEYWNHRNHQKIGCAWTDDPLGEWHRADAPALDTGKDVTDFDSLMVSNPSVCAAGDGRFLMVYKGVSANAPLPLGGQVICGTAWSDTPEGPFTRTGKACFVNPAEHWSVEDPFIWRQDGTFCALVKDFHGYFSSGARAEKSADGALKFTEKRASTALMYSLDGETWQPAENPYAFGLSYRMEDKELPVKNLERVQVYMEDGKPACMLCACAEDSTSGTVYNIRIPLAR